MCECQPNFVFIVKKSCLLIGIWRLMEIHLSEFPPYSEWTYVSWCDISNPQAGLPTGFRIRKRRAKTFWCSSIVMHEALGAYRFAANFWIGPSWVRHCCLAWRSRYRPRNALWWVRSCKRLGFNDIAETLGMHPVTAGRCAAKGEKLVDNDDGIWAIVQKLS